MDRKIVNRKIAKYFNEIGYCQDHSVYIDAIEVPLTFKESKEYEDTWLSAPTCFDAWKWLWKNKKCVINILKISSPIDTWWFSIDGVDTSQIKIEKCENQDDAIEKALDFLVDNNLLK